MLVSGTLADLDVAGIAAMTSLGRTRLRLELRASSGDLIGSMVLKAGRVVSATAGAVRGRDALRVILGSARDTRFQLAPEPLDFVLSSALASVDELWQLARGAVRSAPARDRPDRVVMAGSIDDFDLPTLLHTIGCSRQYCALEIGRAGERAPCGAIRVKAGIVVAASAGRLTGLPAVRRLITGRRGRWFRLVQLAGELPDQVPLGPVGQVLLHADAPAPAARPAAPRPATSAGAAPVELPEVRLGTDAPHPADRAASTRVLRWAIPISFALGGTIVLLVGRGGTPARPVAPEDPPAPLAAPAPAAVPGDVAAATPVEPGPAAGPAPPDATLPADRAGRSIATAQIALAQLGFEPGPVDGVLGRRTRSALLRFQRAHRLRASAALDAQTWSAIAAQLMARRAEP